MGYCVGGDMDVDQGCATDFGGGIVLSTPTRASKIEVSPSVTSSGSSVGSNLARDAADIARIWGSLSCSRPSNAPRISWYNPSLKLINAYDGNAKIANVLHEANMRQHLSDNLDGPVPDGFVLATKAWRR